MVTPHPQGGGDHTAASPEGSSHPFGLRHALSQPFRLGVIGWALPGALPRAEGSHPFGVKNNTRAGGTPHHLTAPCPASPSPAGRSVATPGPARTPCPASPG